MSRLDFLAQAPSRPIDPPSKGTNAALDGQEAGGDSEGGGFDSLLKGLSKEQGKEGMAASRDDAGFPTSGSGDISLKAPTDAFALQAFLPTTALDAAAQGTPSAQPGYLALSLLESLLPRVLPQPASAGALQPGQDGRTMSSLAMVPQPMTDEQDFMTPGFGSKLSVSVENQETHFRPIIESLGAALAEPAMEASAEPINSVMEDGFAKKLPDIEAKATQPSDHGAANRPSIAQDMEKLAQKQLEEQRSATKGSIDRLADRIGLQKQQSMSAAKDDGASLPFATLQQITRAIVDDARAVSGSHEATPQGSGLNHSAVVRASAGVLRVLNLQLNPVELGPMTIKMRLSGESLEMELQVESEDTAELLRNDTEKLSGLLKASGYHPDMITIQSTEAATHDRNASQRPHHSQQMQGQAFHQGASAGHGNPSHQRSDHREREGAELHRNGKDGGGSEHTGSRGVYL